MTIDIEVIRSYIAYGSVSASTVRGLRTPGVVKAARNALREIQLRPYSKATPKVFASLLDIDTERVRKALPNGTQHWGVARKVLNIFLRGSLYNTFLNEHYGLLRLASCFEIPLDSLSANGIRDNSDNRDRPKWPGVKNVTPELNDNYQQLAAKIAAKNGTIRVHLDAVYWGGR